MDLLVVFAVLAALALGALLGLLLSSRRAARENPEISALGGRLAQMAESQSAVQSAIVERLQTQERVVIKAVDEAFPSGDPVWTTEVDLVGNSMGGLVARYATDPTTGDRAVRAAALYGIGTPFLGADIAEVFVLNDMVRDMQPGSSFLANLNDPTRQYGYVLVPYTRSDDTYVGAANTAPPGEVPWWVPAEPFQSGHLTSYGDHRIMADIARRLRGEPPYTTEPRAPLPSK